ncbi:MAG TPA: PilT/PilU family type 4a pilus ATPase [Candidatus Sulfotelmatobacter sp.]|nr:PilT/PilU family type 4a pilus ATPase [Candidatus Sulfotelmatobacter sp.]
MERIPANNSLAKILAWCADQRATDIHGQAGHRYAYRVEGKLLRIPPETFPAPDNDELLRILKETFSTAVYGQIEKQHEMDLSFLWGKLRYRANFSKQQGAQSFSFRVVPQKVPKLDDLQLPPTVSGLIKDPRGFVLVTGASGQGKSTTACAMLQHLNETVPLRIVTIEDPIEYLFEENLCQFEQREVGVDTDSFATGIRNAMRQDPEVIFIGEIRDRESIHAAMQAAETGHLVLATLHADSAGQAIDRVREFYPVDEQANAAALLSRTLNAMISQRLIPSTFNRRVPCVEVMKRNLGIQDAILRNDLRQLNGYIESSLNEGMHSFDQYLLQLYQSGRVTLDVAKHYAVNWNKVEMESRGFVPAMPGILKPDKEA